ncbi:MAG TPA: PIG-L family deacetylase [Candidatus Acidoferrales bacterium]|nr:PIG-L family deacetylase [Candidatus Acidoferrales bacterium]
MRIKPARVLIGILSAAAIAAGIPLPSHSVPSEVAAIDKARVSTRILFITAHPDDEWSSLLTYLARGLHAHVALMTLTRGEGGQNAIGSELDGELGLLRTHELLEAGSYYGVKQFFSRAPDFGFTTDVARTEKIWGDVPVEDMVRVIRTYRPQVVINGWGGVHSGHGNHQTSGILTPHAVAKAADPNAFPQQIAEGLKPWKVALLLEGARGNTSDAVEIPVNDISPLLGESYVDIGMEGHAQHRSQGTPAFFGNRFFRRPMYLVRENSNEEPDGKFDPKLLAQPITAIAAAFPRLQSAMQPALESVEQDLNAARSSALKLDRGAAATSLAQAGKKIESLRDQVAQGNSAEKADALWEIGSEHRAIDKALAQVVALPIDVSADRHELVAGDDFHVTLGIGEPDENALSVPADVVVNSSTLQLPPGWTTTEQTKGEGGTYEFDVSVPRSAKLPTSPAYAVLPFPPPLVSLALKTNVDGYEFVMSKPVEHLSATTTGILTYPLELVPAVTLSVEEPEIMVPVKRASGQRTLLTRVRYHGAKPAKVSVGIDLPSGWTAQSVAPLDFSSPGDELIRFSVQPPATLQPGAYVLHPFAKLDGETFRTSLNAIPNLPTRDWSKPDDVTVHVLDLVVPEGLRVGYIAGDNDPLPGILRQIGIRVDMLDEAALAFGNLSQYDAITVGIRAYELRPDVMRSNGRLLSYVRNGGTLLVQYERDFAWNRLKPAPYPATMPDQTSRVTVPTAPVRFLAPQNPLLNHPNKITEEDFKGWVQERGLYFWGDFDSKYQPVLGIADPGKPETKGSLVYARIGKGVYIYTGLSFFRELPAGVPGAYRLFVNLVSQTPRRAH